MGENGPLVLFILLLVVIVVAFFVWRSTNADGGGMLSIGDKQAKFGAASSPAVAQATDAAISAASSAVSVV